MIGLKRGKYRFNLPYSSIREHVIGLRYNTCTLYSSTNYLSIFYFVHDARILHTTNERIWNTGQRLQYRSRFNESLFWCILLHTLPKMSHKNSIIHSRTSLWWRCFENAKVNIMSSFPLIRTCTSSSVTSKWHTITHYGIYVFKGSVECRESGECYMTGQARWFFVITSLFFQFTSENSCLQFI